MAVLVGTLMLLAVAFGPATASPSTSPDPEPTASVVPTPTATTDPVPTVSPTATTDPVDPEPSPSVIPTPEPEPTEEPAAPPVLRPLPPAASKSSAPAALVAAAVLVVLASIGLLLWLQSRLQRRAQEAPTVEFPRVGTRASTAETFAAVQHVGEAMLDAGYPVGTVQESLEEIAWVNGHPSTSVVAFPTALIVSARGKEQVHTGAVTTSHWRWTLHQVDALDRLVEAARAGGLAPDRASTRIGQIRALRPSYPPVWRVGAYAALCAALATLLGGGWAGIAFAALVGALVGTVQLFTVDLPRRYDPLVTVGLAFGVSVAVFLVARSGWSADVLPSLIAPLVILLPGGLLTTGVIELASGQMMSGAGRLAAGFMQLVLLAVGIVSGARLVGIPELDLTALTGAQGAVAPWIAVAVFGAGIVINRGGRARSIPWILLVLYVAYGAQVIGSIFVGGVLAAAVGAFAMTPVAMLIARHPSGPAARVSFLPAFWMLVPGSLGLIGVASLLGGEGAGTTTLVTMISTMVAIALGILAGTALGERLRLAGPTP